MAVCDYFLEYSLKFSSTNNFHLNGSFSDAISILVCLLTWISTSDLLGVQTTLMSVTGFSMVSAETNLLCFSGVNTSLPLILCLHVALKIYVVTPRCSNVRYIVQIPIHRFFRVINFVKCSLRHVNVLQFDGKSHIRNVSWNTEIILLQVKIVFLINIDIINIFFLIISNKKVYSQSIR